MKKLRLLFSALALLLCSTSLLAHDFEVDGIYYTITSRTDLTVAVSCKEYPGYDYSYEYSGSVTIPELVTYDGNTYSVTSIGDDAFSDCKGLTSVTIPNSVTSIGNSAFENCHNLTSVTIGNSVTSIGSNAFRVCEGLTSVTIPNSVTSIGVGAFLLCYGLTSVHISDIAAWCKIDFGGYTGCNPLEYAKHLFLDGEEIKDLVIPNSVTSIGIYAFFSYKGLTSVTIPNSVKSIGKNAFAECSELTDVYCYAEKVPSTGTGVFIYSPLVGYATLHVPAASIGYYKSTYPWSSFGKIVALTEEETGMEDIAVEDVNINDAPVYNLQGMKMQNADNLPKGIYIKGGKKFVVK